MEVMMIREPEERSHQRSCFADRVAAPHGCQLPSHSSWMCRFRDDRRCAGIQGSEERGTKHRIGYSARKKPDIGQNIPEVDKHRGTIRHPIQITTQKLSMAWVSSIPIVRAHPFGVDSKTGARRRAACGIKRSRSHAPCVASDLLRVNVAEVWVWAQRTAAKQQPVRYREIHVPPRKGAVARAKMFAIVWPTCGRWRRMQSGRLLSSVRTASGETEQRATALSLCWFRVHCHTGLCETGYAKACPIVGTLSPSACRHVGKC